MSLRKFFWIGSLFALVGFTPIYSRHDTVEKVDSEITHIANDVQSRQFTVWTTTPSLNDIRDGEFIIFVATQAKVMFRSGQEIYSINLSCVTVRR